MSENTPPHADPTDPAIAAILAFDLDEHNSHDAIAAALAPHVEAAPHMRGWSDDDEWTPAEEAVMAATRFVDGVANPASGDPWLRNQEQLDHLLRMQRAHRERTVLDRLGEFPGYQLRVFSWFPLGETVRVWEAGVSINFSPSILSLGADTTRREIEIAIAAWKAGYSRGSEDGASRVRDGIKELLHIEDA